MTATGFAVGTPAYMSPEAHCGGQIDARSDQWSFCVALYEALYGERPFLGKDVQELLGQVLSDRVRPPASSVVPHRVRDLIVRGLSLTPEDRWPSMTALLEQLRPRRRPWPWILAGGAAAAGLGALAFALVTDSTAATACDRAAEAVTEVWGDDARAAVHEAFTRSAAPYAEGTWERVAVRLDAQASDLTEARRDACEATPTLEAGAEDIDRRTTCLSRRLSELRGLVAVLGEADAATVRNSVQAVGDLRPVSTCASAADGVMAPPPSIAADVERAHDDLARVRAMDRAGHYGRALELVEQVIMRAEHLGHAPLVAEARALHGIVLSDNGQYDAAERELSEARLAAQAAGHDVLVAKTSTALVSLLGVELRRPEDADRWVRHAHAAIERLADPAEARIHLEAALGSVRQSGGDFEVARGHYERALAATEERRGRLHPQAITMRNNIALTYQVLGDNVRAREMLEGVLADRIEVFGPGHPEVSKAHGNLGVVEQILGQLDASVDYTQQALDGLEISVGTQHPMYPQLLTNLGNTKYLMGKLDEALEIHQRCKQLLVQSVGPRAFLVGRSFTNIGAIHNRARRHEEARAAYLQAQDILEEHLRPDHPELAVLIGNIAQVDRETERYDEALAGFERSLELLERAYGPDHYELAYSLAGRGQTHVDAGRPAQAVDDLRRALGLLEAAKLDEVSATRMRYDLARALWGTGDAAEARALMARARAEEQQRGEQATLTEDIEQWWSEHGEGEP